MGFILAIIVIFIAVHQNNKRAEAQKKLQAAERQLTLLLESPLSARAIDSDMPPHQEVESHIPQTNQTVQIASIDQLMPLEREIRILNKWMSEKDAEIKSLKAQTLPAILEIYEKKENTVKIFLRRSADANGTFPLELTDEVPNQYSVFIGYIHEYKNVELAFFEPICDDSQKVQVYKLKLEEYLLPCCEIENRGTSGIQILEKGILQKFKTHWAVVKKCKIIA